MLIFLKRRMYSGMLTLLVLLLSYGKIVQGKCPDLYTYPHPHSSTTCLLCRICPSYVIANKTLFLAHRQPLCGNLSLPDGRKVQCSSRDFDAPSCPDWKPSVGHLNCTNNSTVYSICLLQCPSGYMVSHEVNVKCLAQPEIHWSHQHPVCHDIDECRTNNLNCSHECVNTKGGANCVCPTGFLLHSDGKECIDIDECVNNSLQCSDTCINTKGSAFCTCSTGSTLASDQKTCLAYDQDSRGAVPHKHAHKVLSVVAIILLCLLFLLGPWLLLICLIQWRTRQIQHQREANQAQNSIQLVKIKLSNAKRNQRCYVLRNKWIAKKGSNVTVSAVARTCVVTNLIVIKKEQNRRSPPMYSSLPSAPNEIVLHSVSSLHTGQYDWITHLTNNTTECGTFHLDVKMSPCSEAAALYSRQCSRESYYQQIEQEEGDTIQASSCGFGKLLKNMKDVKRLCILFDQDERSETVSWHVIAMSSLINYDRQAVNNDEYHLKSKTGCQGPTYKMLTLLNHNGTSVQEFVDFLQPLIGQNSEAVQILNKYL